MEKCVGAGAGTCLRGMVPRGVSFAEATGHDERYKTTSR